MRMIDIILWTQPVDGVLRLNSDRCQEEHQNKEKLLFHDNSIVCVIWITFVMYRIVHTEGFGQCGRVNPLYFNHSVQIIL